MGRAAAGAASAVFFVLAPDVVAGLVPWWPTGWRVEDPLPYWAPLRLLGALLLVTGLGVLIRAFGQFVAEGVGTPAPVAPTERLVVGGLYRFVRNPMYLAVLANRGYEEPALRRRYGAHYDSYRRAVPGWWPRYPRGDARRS
jgi:protein-S-isoprenylcysteine O-methyltransferase Ste14